MHGILTLYFALHIPFQKLVESARDESPDICNVVKQLCFTCFLQCEFELHHRSKFNCLCIYPILIAHKNLAELSLRNIWILASNSCPLKCQWEARWNTWCGTYCLHYFPDVKRRAQRLRVWNRRMRPQWSFIYPSCKRTTVGCSSWTSIVSSRGCVSRRHWVFVRIHGVCM